MNFYAENYAREPIHFIAKKQKKKQIRHMPRVRRILPNAVNQFRGPVYLLRFVANSSLTDRANITALDLAKGRHRSVRRNRAQ